jgi:hypothetical protein
MEIKRTVELYLARRLMIEELMFYAYHGGRDGDDRALAGTVEPPFGVVGIAEADEMVTGTNLYTLQGAVVIVSHLQDTSPADQSAWVEHAKTILDQVNADCHTAILTPKGFQFILHGIDIGRNRSSDSEEDKAHADTLGFTAGATLLPELTPIS